MDKLQQNPRPLLIAGIVLRVITYYFLAPANNDEHLEVIRFITDHGRLPATAELVQAQHPPLYYLLAAAVWELSASAKVVQLLSLAFSIATLVVLYRLITKTKLLESPVARHYSLLLASFLPQFVMFTLYVSNDSLAILLGCLTIAQAHRFVEVPGWKQLLWLAALSGLGVATKGTIVGFLPVLSVLAFFITRSRTHSWRRSFLAAFTFMLVVAALGSYKYIDNYVRYQDPMTSSLNPKFHFEFAREQAVGYRGAGSFLNGNILLLLASPSVSAATEHAYPLMLYGTFWYQHISESNFAGNRHRPYNYLGSAIYVLGLFPSLLIFVGMFSYFKHLPDLRLAFTRYGEADRLLIMRYVSVLVLCFLFLFFPATLFRYHVYSLAQARLLFPGLFGILVAFSRGVEVFRTDWRAMGVLRFNMNALVAAFLVYFGTECAFVLLKDWSPGLKVLIKSL